MKEHRVPGHNAGHVFKEFASITLDTYKQPTEPGLAKSVISISTSLSPNRMDR